MHKRSNVGRKLTTTENFQRKVELLQEILRVGPPEGVTAPKSMNAFREWEVPSRGLERIGSPSTTNVKLAPHNRLLIEEAEKCIREISRRARQKRPAVPSLKAQISIARDEVKAQEKLRDVLTAQLQEAMHRLDSSSAAAEHAQASLKTLQEINALLRRQLGNAGIVPILPVKK